MVFIDRYFDSTDKILNPFKSKNVIEYDPTALYTYLNSLHSLNDRLVQLGIKDLSKSRDFKLLRLLRNYLHHNDELKEKFTYSFPTPLIMQSHAINIMVPISSVAKSIISYKNRETNENRAEKYLSKIFTTPDQSIILDMRETLVDHDKLILDGVERTLAYDVYKDIYNVTNLIADICKNDKNLSENNTIKSLDWTYTVSNNIPENDIRCLPGVSGNVFTTMDGIIVAESYSLLK